MEKNYEIGDFIWDTKIPAKLKIHHLNLGSDNEPPIFYVIIFHSFHKQLRIYSIKDYDKKNSLHFSLLRADS